MAYTRPWAQVMNLPGSRMAHEIDDENREGHTDFTERFSSILVDVTADPWVLKLPGLTGAAEFSQHYMANAFPVVAGTPTFTLNSVHPSLGNGNLNVNVPIVYWQGTRITNLGIHGIRNHASAVVQATLYRVDDTGSVTPVVVVSLSAVSASFQSAVSAALTENMDANRAYFVQAVITAGPTALGVDAQLAKIHVSFKLAGTF